MSDDHRCETVDGSDPDASHARVSPEMSDEGRAALVELMKAAIRSQAELDSGDPEGAAERGRRQQAARERARQWRGEGG